MARKRMIVELGMGVDLHGMDYTKSARRAVEDAIHRGSLLFLADALRGGNMPKVYVDVLLASPKPDAVDAQEVLKALPVGEGSVEVVQGGLTYTRQERDNIIISNAAVTVSVDA
jgi:uncharacterized protein (TIGR02058 family)